MSINNCFYCDKDFECKDSCNLSQLIFHSVCGNCISTRLRCNNCGCIAECMHCNYNDLASKCKDCNLKCWIQCYN